MKSKMEVAGTHRAPVPAMETRRETRSLDARQPLPAVDTHRETGSLDAGEAATHVIESAVRLARAEATLALAHGRTLVVRAVSAWAAVMFAAAAGQVALVLIALAPTLFQSPGALLLALTPSVALSAFGLLFAVRSLRKLSDPITPGATADDR